jgi:hypothetical protein
MNISEKSLEFCLRLEKEYLERVGMLKEKAESCNPAQRGAYLSHAAQRQKDAIRMRANYDAQMGWLVENNYELYLEMKQKYG